MLNPGHILITGASSGIGAALAELYAKPGVRLSLHGRDANRLRQIAGRAREKGATVQTGTGDVTETGAMAVWINQCDQILPLDLVIANAGISAGGGTGHESAGQSRAIFETNLTGALNTVHPVLPLMARRGRGQIALMSSLASFRGLVGAPSYCASKAALRIYGEALRSEWGPKGIEINVICPGFIKTPLTDANRFPMPFIMGAGRAAEIIRKGLAQNRARIAFPFVMYAMIRLLAALPQDWLDKPLALLPRKNQKT